MSSENYSSVLANLRAQQDAQPLSILSLAEPITTSQTQTQANAQPSPRSTSKHAQKYQISDSFGTAEAESSLYLTPTNLAADLTHYKDLFSKLRFSYLEQVTKEKYLRSIVGDPPLLVSHEDNLRLEEKLATLKAELKKKKEDVDVLVQEMEDRARAVAQRYETVNQGMEMLERMPAEIEALRAEVESLQREIANQRGEQRGSEDPRMQMSLAATEQALAEQRERNAEVDRKIAELQKQMPGKVKQVEKMDRELAELERKRNESTRLAIELRRRREAGGRDEMDDLGRWYRANEAVMKGLLGIEGQA
jgi:chromosome segregation ATPase